MPEAQLRNRFEKGCFTSKYRFLDYARNDGNLRWLVLSQELIAYSFFFGNFLGPFVLLYLGGRPPFPAREGAIESS